MNTKENFTGFYPETFRFFAELKENNYKPWFDANKSIYETKVLQPLKALAVALTPAFYEVDPLMEFRPNKMISRIYRDIRFSHDKTPYKSQMWISFQRPFLKKNEDWASFPGYYMEIGEEGVGFGMGLFQAKKKTMDSYRDRISYDPDSFKEITGNLLDNHGFKIGGEEYKRPIKTDLSEYFQPWIQRKGIYLQKHLSDNQVFYSPDFVQYMEKEFAPLHPFYDFLVDVCD